MNSKSRFNFNDERSGISTQFLGFTSLSLAQAPETLLHCTCSTDQQHLDGRKMGTTSSSEQTTGSENTIEWYPISLLQRSPEQAKNVQDQKAGFALVVLNQPFADTHLGLIQKLWKNGKGRLTPFVAHPN